MRRSHQHRTGIGSRFASRYGVKLLVYFEIFEDVGHAIRREKAIKSWPRAWKVDLIEARNPTWRDLYPEIAI
jgi:putative endonuclease